MEHFIIILLSILVLIILALYIHKVILYNHIQEEIQVVFNNLANINSFINSKLDNKEQSQSQNTTLHKLHKLNIIDENSIESFEVEHDIKKDDNVMVNIITNKVVEDIKDNERNIIKHWCDNCKYKDLSSQYEHCNTCISEGIAKICK